MAVFGDHLCRAVEETRLRLTPELHPNRAAPLAAVEQPRQQTLRFRGGRTHDKVAGAMKYKIRKVAGEKLGKGAVRCLNGAIERNRDHRVIEAIDQVAKAALRFADDLEQMFELVFRRRSGRRLFDAAQFS